MLASFAVSRFLVNFGKLQCLAEKSSGTNAIKPSLSSEASSAEEIVSPSAAPTVSTRPVKLEVWLPELTSYRHEWVDEHVRHALMQQWLAPVNRYRVMVRVAPVTADDQLNLGDFLHAHYLATNHTSSPVGFELHIEDPAKPGFTAEGRAAARASDVAWRSDPHGRPNPSWAIDDWIQVPFHRLPIINPYLLGVGYGFYCEGAVCAAALNVLTDIASPSTSPSRWSKPLAFPPDGSVVDIGTFTSEWPDPLTSCPGYTSPAGLPITLELGPSAVLGFSDCSIRRANANSAAIEACAFNADTYTNPDAAAQTNARNILRNFGAIVIVPRHPLSPGRYVVALTAGQKYSWSFSVVPPSKESSGSSPRRSRRRASRRFRSPQ